MEDRRYDLHGYRHLMKVAIAEGYRFEPFTVEQPVGKTLFLRHDIDYSWHWARLIAAENAASGARGTFFIQLRSPLYNAFSFESIGAMREILGHGQWIALHLTIDEACDSFGKAQRLLSDDWATFRTIVPECQPVFAWHNPSVWVSSRTGFLGADFPGFINVYGRFAGSAHPYYSDSNLRYSIGEFEAILRKRHASLQLALAPMQWAPGAEDMVDVLAANLAQKVRDAETEFATNHVYREKLGGRLPDSVIDAFRKLIRGSAGS